MTNLQEEQRLAAEAAVELVQSGMVVGLGTGSTAAHAIRALGRRCQEGLRITGIPTSTRSGELATELGIPLVPLVRTQQIDITIDGADEFDPALNLTKGGGGALLREKIVAFCSKQLVIVADSNKKVQQLGAFALPCEVLPFAVSAIKYWMEYQYNIPVVIRQSKTEADSPFLTDQGNFILDCKFGTIADPADLSNQLDKVPGLVGHGLFTAMADVVFLGTGGVVQQVRRLS